MCDRDKPFFIFDPDDSSMSFYATAEERDREVSGVIDNYLDDCWDEMVTQVVAGVITHRAQMVNRVERPDDVDEDGWSPDGDYWNDDWDYKCGYKALPVLSSSKSLGVAIGLLIGASEAVHSLGDRWAGAGEIADDLTKIAKELQDLKGPLELTEAVDRHRESTAVLRNAEFNIVQVGE